MENVLEGKVWKFGANVNTDEIIPAKYLNTTKAEELAAFCMDDTSNEEFKKSRDNKEIRGSIFVAGEYFGCGSSREHAPISIKAAGISAIIAPDFASIFYRNAINTGLPIFKHVEAAEEILQGDIVSIDLEKGVIYNKTQDKKYDVVPFTGIVKEVSECGGLMNYVKKIMNKI